MNYQKIYDRIISRGRERVLAGYKEQHHIIPRCMGGTDNPDNLVHLTPEEHYVCHQLLVKIHPNNIKLLYAAHAMSLLHSKNHSPDRHTNKKYGWLRRKHSALQRTGKIITCKCGKDFYVAKYRLDRYSSFFCTNKCKNQYIVKRKPEYVNIPCLNCNKNMTMTKKYYDSKKKKFCSHSCSSAYNNAVRKTGRGRIKN